MRLIDQLIDAFALLHRRLPASLRIPGFIEDIACHQQLLDQIQCLELAEVVQFLDPVPSPAEDPARQEVDLVWMISLSGHVGFAGLDAMAAGMPILLLEADTNAYSTEVDIQLQDLICNAPSELVEHSLALRSDPDAFLRVR